MIAIATDVTDRARLEHRLQQAERDEAIARLAGGVAHDVNNLLTVILAASDVLSDLLTDVAVQVPGVPALLQSIADGAQRGARLTEHLLAFGRRQALRPVAVDLAAISAELATVLGEAVADGHTIELDVPAATGPILVDREQFTIALANLCRNASDALGATGDVHVAVRNAGQFVAVAVTDAGRGMTDAVRDRAIEPFFTTKAVGASAGAGLGLSMVHGFTLQSDGHLTIESSPGAGTTVTMHLPRAT